MEKIYGEEDIFLPEEMLDPVTLQPFLPTIDDNRLRELYKTLKPIVTIEEIKYLLKEFTLEQLRNQSYIWNVERDNREIVEPGKLEIVDDFLCLHSWGHYGLFKPSIAEVLAQVHDYVAKEANTFEIIESLQTREDVFRYSEIIDNGFHLSKVRAYKMHK